MRSIRQIAAVVGQTGSRVYALCHDGSVWFHDDDGDGWTPVPAIPDLPNAPDAQTIGAAELREWVKKWREGR